jgi:glycosyltransferase involved in cell wall biosynthesis
MSGPADPIQPRVSYIMATKNHGAHLGKVLANIREFIEPTDELIIADGGSTDNTTSVIEEHRDIITLFISEPDHGEAHALNKAIFRSRGQYIKPVTDDDYLYPDAMRNLVQVIDAHPEIDAIQCGGEVWDLRSKDPAYDGLRFLPTDVSSNPNTLFSNVLCGLGLIVRRSAMERIGGVSSNYRAVDADLMCRLIECRCNLRYLDIKLFRWHIYPHSGLNEPAKYSHDFALINLRLGNLRTFMQHDPSMFLSLAPAGAGARDQALAYWIWFASLLGRSPIWRAAFPLFWIVSQIVRLKRSLRVHAVNISNVPHKSHEWTGQLR